MAKSEDLKTIADRTKAFAFDLLTEFSHLSAGDVLGAIAGVAGGASSAPAPAAKKVVRVKTAKTVKTSAPKAKAAPKKKAGVSTRTKDGRAAFDAKVLEGLSALGGKEVAAENLRKKIGGTPHQLRASLNRHIDAGAVSYTGARRATRYHLA